MSKAAASAGEEPDPKQEKITLLKAIELIIAKPENIKKQTHAILAKYRKRYKDDRTDDDIKELVANKVIQNYS